MSPRKKAKSSAKLKLKLSKPYIAVLLISIISGGAVYGYDWYIHRIPTDGHVEPDKGNLSVIATLEGNPIAIAVSATGPQSLTGTTTTMGNPLTWTDVSVGTYTVSGMYQGTTKIDSKTVTKDSTVTATLAFTSTLPPTGFSFKKTHIILTGVNVNWPSLGYTPTDAQIRADAQQIKDLGFTAAMTYDQVCDHGTYDDNPTQYREYRAFQIYQELGLYLIPQVGNWGNGECTATHLQKSAAWMKTFPNCVGLYFDDMQALGSPTIDWIHSNFNLGRDYVILFGVDQNPLHSMPSYNDGSSGFAFLSYCYSYYAAGGNGRFKGTQWVQDAANTYSVSSGVPYRTVAPFLDAFEFSGLWGGAVDPNMWQPQVSTAEQNGMLMLAWFIYYSPNVDDGGGFKPRTQWYSTIASVNSQYHDWLDSIS